ncbi:MAG: 16S rRNA (guanine(527)-N(7))-methyltransferase RsmG [Bacteroidales bacterium OttesenSCG-928-I14]|jgi:16S rRNA (guanine527-N7)-methyltransferase|nr:16S rRNA (guanine(527)-N(7))-methyltransferase RsmG [Bacteroidales bacterium OttesenSCG-928-I14]
MNFEKNLIKYFPHIINKQKLQFFTLYDLYSNWNKKINLISRNDIENLYERHVLHSLGIAQVVSFCNYSTILDVGTGGGFPGIPLAILFPNVQFLLLDAIKKKIRVVKKIAYTLNLKNVECKCIQAKNENGQFDFIVSRATMSLQKLVTLTKKNISKNQKNTIHNGFLCLKGGDLQNELKPYKKKVVEYKLNNFFQEKFFETKKVIYLPV